MAFSPIQHQHYNAATAGPVTWTFPQASAAGTFLLMVVAIESFNAAKPAAPSGWTLQTVFSTTNQFGGNYWTLHYTMANNPGGITSFTLPAASSSYADASGVFGEFPGVASSSITDQSGHTDNPSGSSVSSSTVTATGSNTGAGDLVIASGCVGGFGAGETMTVTSSTPGLTLLDAQTAGNTSHPVLVVFYGTSGSVGETDTAVLHGSSSDAWSSLIYTYLAASAPSAPNSGFLALMGA